MEEVLLKKEQIKLLKSEMLGTSCLNKEQ